MPSHAPMLGALMIEVSPMGRAAERCPPTCHMIEVLLGWEWEGFPYCRRRGSQQDPLHATQSYGGNLFGAGARHPARSRGRGYMVYGYVGCGLDGF